MNDSWVWALLAVGLFNALLLLWLALRGTGKASALADEEGRAQLMAAGQAGNERLARELRHEIQESSRGGRLELAQNLATFQQSLVQQAAVATRTQNTQIDAFGQQLALLQKSLSDTLTTQLSNVSESNARRMAEVRQTLEAQLAQLQQSNAAKLDEMRATVDEKLQATLHARLGESFKQVAE
ncbi:MAG: DNA recombination protein RmuC, partial [Hylemonella sp.]|nr:DNA recombination protein RmuC [Hylemonella sp.]